MASQLITPLALIAVGAGITLAVQAWARRTAHLNLGLFRPWRGDAWPIGVQEDDDFRFNWSPASPDAPGPALAGFHGSSAEWTVEEVTRTSGRTVPVRRVRTRAGDAVRPHDD